MKIEDFVKQLKQCKKSSKMTGYLETQPVQVNKERTYSKLRCTFPRTRFKDERNASLVVKFHKPQKNLTIFQSQMLLMVFANNEIPYDYASYHKCIAGKEFIENIKSINEKDLNDVLLKIKEHQEAIVELIKEAKAIAEKENDSKI